ncbi:hypothetical protein CYMTET_28217, partial [Cymbomonas tetramitiformis]
VVRSREDVTQGKFGGVVGVVLKHLVRVGWKINLGTATQHALLRLCERAQRASPAMAFSSGRSLSVKGDMQEAGVDVPEALSVLRRQQLDAFSPNIGTDDGTGSGEGDPGADDDKRRALLRQREALSAALCDIIVRTGVNDIAGGDDLSKAISNLQNPLEKMEPATPDIS